MRKNNKNNKNTISDNNKVGMNKEDSKKDSKRIDKNKKNNKAKLKESPTVKIRKKKGKISLFLGILFLVTSLFMLIVTSISLFNKPDTIVPLSNKILALINPNFSFISNNNIGLYPTAIVLFILSLSIFNYRKYKPFSYINLVIGIAISYTLYLLANQAFNSQFPKYFEILLENNNINPLSVSANLIMALIGELVLLMVLSPLIDALNSKWYKHLVTKQLEMDKLIVKKQQELASSKIDGENEISLKNQTEGNKIDDSSFNIDLPLPVDVPPLSFIDKKINYDTNNNYSEVPSRTEELIKKQSSLTPQTTSEKKILNNTSSSNSLSNNTVPISTLELAKKNVEERLRKEREKEGGVSNSNNNPTIVKNSSSENGLPRVSAAVRAYSEPSDSDVEKAKMVTTSLFSSNKTPLKSKEEKKKHHDSSIANIMASGHLVSATQKYQNQENNRIEKPASSISSKMDDLLESLKEKPKSSDIRKEGSSEVSISNFEYQNTSDNSIIENSDISAENNSTQLEKASENNTSDFSTQYDDDCDDCENVNSNVQTRGRYIATDAPSEEEKEAMRAKKTVYSSELYSNGSLNNSDISPSPNQVSVGNYHSSAKPLGDSKLVDEEESMIEDLDNDIDDLESAIAGLSSSRVVESARSQYRFPPLELVREYPETSNSIDPDTQEKLEKLVQTLAEFKYVVKPRRIIKGPTVTMFEIVPEPGIRVNSITNLSDNIAMNLMAQKVRILAPIPGEAAVGVEVPNDIRDIVGFRDILSKSDCTKMAIPMTMGRDLYGNCKLFDVASAPHMLVAGSTGSGKSVCINSLICSILYTRTPKEVRLIMVDPKVVELTIYNGIPHLLTPVITETKRALKALDFCIDEMERRNKMLAKMAVRNIKSYNQKIKENRFAMEKMPYIVVIIDEFASLMSIAGKDLDEKVSRLTAMSRAVGIHLVFATQRPSVDVITGVIKNNLPTRVAFAVTSSQDSRTIIGTTGAENLLGKGDLLLSENGKAVSRLQGVFLSDDEVGKIVNFAKTQGPTDYIDESYFESYDDDSSDDGIDTSYADDEDSLWDAAIKILLERKSISASFLQRRLRIGYNRAARIVEEMEEKGLVGPANGSKPRELIKYPDMLDNK